MIIDYYRDPGNVLLVSMLAMFATPRTLLDLNFLVGATKNTLVEREVFCSGILRVPWISKV